MSSVKKARITSGSISSSPSTTAGTTTPTAPATSAEQIHSAVYRYLQRRRYASGVTDTFRKESHPPKEMLSQTKQEMALRELLTAETSSNNSVSFSTNNFDPIIVDQQYSKFKIWISESLDSYKPELAQLLYPLFTHLYLELVASGHKFPATKFLKKHQSTFLGNAEFANFIRQLATITMPEEIAVDEVISSYIASRYSVTLSNRTFHYLMKYLQQDKQPPILLQILHSKVDIRLSDVLSACSKVEAVDRHRLCVDGGGSEVVKSEARSLPSANHLIKKTDDVQKLQETIRHVRESTTPLPSTCLYRINCDATNVTTSRISGDSCHMAVGCDDSSIQLWNLYPPSSTHSEVPSSTESTNPVSSVGLGHHKHIPESSRLPSLSDSRILRGHSGPVYGVAFVPNSNFLISCSEDTTLRCWDYTCAANRSIYRGHSYPVWSVDIDRLGLNIATGSMDRTAKLWHLEYTFPLRVYAGHEKDVDVVRFHPNCNYLATAGADKTVRLWSHADAKMVRVLSGHRGGIFSLAFSPDGKILASAGEDRRIRLWDLASSTMLKELRGHSDTIYSLVWSQDSSLLSSGGLDGTIRLWNIGNHQTQLPNGPQSEVSQTSVSAELVATYPTSCSNIIDLWYSPHNSLVATGSGVNHDLGTRNFVQIKTFQLLNGSNTGS